MMKYINSYDCFVFVVQQFYNRLEIQYREFLQIRPIDIFANYCLAAIASLAITVKS